MVPRRLKTNARILHVFEPSMHLAPRLPGAAVRADAQKLPRLDLFHFVWLDVDRFRASRIVVVQGLVLGMPTSCLGAAVPLRLLSSKQGTERRKDGKTQSGNAALESRFEFVAGLVQDKSGPSSPALACAKGVVADAGRETDYHRPCVVRGAPARRPAVRRQRRLEAWPPRRCRVDGWRPRCGFSLRRWIRFRSRDHQAGKTVRPAERERERERNEDQNGGGHALDHVFGLGQVEAELTRVYVLTEPSSSPSSSSSTR